MGWGFYWIILEFTPVSLILWTNWCVVVGWGFYWIILEFTPVSLILWTNSCVVVGWGFYWIILEFTPVSLILWTNWCVVVATWRIGVECHSDITNAAGFISYHAVSFAFALEIWISRLLNCSSEESSAGKTGICAVIHVVVAGVHLADGADHWSFGWAWRLKQTKTWLFLLQLSVLPSYFS